MRVEIDAEEELRDLYVKYPEFLSNREIELVDSILFHLSQNVSFRIGATNGEIVITTLEKSWKR